MDWHNRFVQQSRWTVELRRYLFDRAGIATAHRILEVGCGTGAIIMNLIPSQGISDDKGKTPELQVYGLDINSDFLLQAAQHAPAVRLTSGDAHTLPYATSTFDIVFCHFLLLWVANPAQVLSEMVRVSRTGGYIMALAEPDYGGRIDYPDSLAEVGTMQESALRDQGADTRLGRRLRALIQQSGLTRIEAGVMGGQWQGSQFSEEMDQEWQTLKADLDGMLRTDELNRLNSLDAESWRKGERILFVPTFYAWGQKQ